MNCFTYLLGAGSSIHAIPVVNLMKPRMRSIIRLLHTLYSLPDDPFPSQYHISVTKKRAQEEFYEGIEWLIKSSGNNSIDSYAKKLFHTQELRTLNKLKAILSCYLQLEQSVDEHEVINALEFHFGELDYRYGHFIARIIDSSGHIKPEFKIISWNYDIQLEKAYMTFFNRNDLSDFLLEELHSYPIPGRKLVDVNLDQFNIIRLNGTAGYHLHNGDLYAVFNPSVSSISLYNVGEIIRNYYLYVHQPEFIRPFINFAWENNNISEHYIKQAIRVGSSTKELIIIGYSFPDFNREIDKKIISSMSTLERIYIQNTESEAKKIKRLLQDILRNKELEFIIDNNLDQFLLPTTI
jgi:hypothetical protein